MTTFSKTCVACGAELNKEDFLFNPAVDPVGIKINHMDPSKCFIFFVHRVTGCHATILASSEELEDQYDGLTIDEGSSSLLCSGNYAAVDLSAECEEDCACRSHRLVLQKLIKQRSATIVGQ